MYKYVRSCHVQETMRTTNNNNLSNQPQKYQLCTCSTLLSTFAVVLHDNNDKNSTNLPVTRFTEEMYVFLFTSFHCSSFSPWWPLAFLIFSPPLSNFHVFRPKKLASVVLILALLPPKRAGCLKCKLSPPVT